VTTRCFATFSEAIAHSTGGWLRLPASASTVEQAQLDDAQLRARSAGALSNPLLGIEWWNYGYSGSSWTIYGQDGTGCYAA